LNEYSLNVYSLGRYSNNSTLCESIIMAQQEVTGITTEEIAELREEFLEKPEGDLYDLEDRYCLVKIPHQPEDYDGPDRYCPQRASDKTNDVWRCRAHKGRGTSSPGEELQRGNPKHHMYSTPDYLLEHLSEEEQEVYDEIMSWAEKYGIDKEEDPAVYDDLQMLAVERVRSIKTGEYILKEGETRETPIYGEDGLEGYEDDTNAISEEHRRLIGLIQSLKKDLGLTRKEQMKADDRNIMAESADTTSEAMSELVSDEDKKFNVDEYEP